jgi:3-hydroxybutyryl-CoA dehydrogenase
MSEVLEDYGLTKQSATNDTLHKVAVIGCGSIGQEIVRTISQHGFEVVFLDQTPELVAEILKKIEAQLDDIINKWGLTESEKRAILSRIKGTTDYKDIRNCGLVIESLYTDKAPNLEVRRDVFKKVEAVVSEKAIICSNSSTLIISELANVLAHPERAVGLHFLTPESTVKIVEVAKGLKTNDQSLDIVCKFAQKLEKKTIVLNESLGNISTRLICTLINEACDVLMEGVASAEAIDETMRLGFGMQFGPLEMADKIGLDKILRYMNNLYTEFGLHKFKPSPIIKRLVRANHLGRKTNIGFYVYEDKKRIGIAFPCPEFRI